MVGKADHQRLGVDMGLADFDSMLQQALPLGHMSRGSAAKETSAAENKVLQLHRYFQQLHSRETRLVSFDLDHQVCHSSW